MWYAKYSGGYLRTSVEAHVNANNIAGILVADGWDRKSIAALLGNGAGESGLNPWRWEDNTPPDVTVPTVSQFENWTIAEAQHHGYGIFQFTPASKYINSANAMHYASAGYSPNFADQPGTAQDGNAQTLFFVSTVASEWATQLYAYYYDDFINIGVDITPWYYTTYSNFKIGQDNNGNDLTLAELVGVFELDYERPGDTYAASSYASRVSNAEYWYDEISPTPPTPGTYRKMPWIYYLKRRRR